MKVSLRAIAILSTILLSGVTSCNIQSSVDDVIDQLQQTMQAITAQSDAWRTALPQLINQMGNIESQASADTKSIVDDTRNQVQDLSNDTIQFASINAQEIVAKTGVEYRCDANFTMNGVAARLQYLINDLKFWKANKRHQDQKPVHSICQILSENLSLYPQANGNYAIDSSKLIAANVVEVYGYNFRADAMPTLNLVNAAGSVVRAVNVRPAYVTQYQISIDFSTETFAGIAAGSRVVFNWPDQTEPNTISLIIAVPAKLKIINAVFTPPSPIATKDAVSLAVTITNTGTVPSGAFTVTWTPQGGGVKSVSQLPMQPGTVRSVAFPQWVYQSPGSNSNSVALSNGDDVKSYPIAVQSNIASTRDYPINKPVVNREWSSTGIAVGPGDKVEIINGGGCVNTHGSGKTTKRYINPLDENNSCRINTKLYFGTIAIPGTIEEGTRESLNDFMTNRRSVIVNRASTIELGYVDDNLSDNDYNSFDPGTCDQCRGVGPAYVTIRVTKFR